MRIGAICVLERYKRAAPNLSAALGAKMESLRTASAFRQGSRKTIKYWPKSPNLSKGEELIT